MRLFKPIIRKIKKGRILSFLFKNLLYATIRFLFWTYRLRIVHAPGMNKSLEEHKGIMYFWHQQIVSGMFFFFKRRAHGACIVSPSSDGKFAGFICQKLGFDVIYGSSYKSSVSVVRKALDELTTTGRLCLVGDGSRGPAFQVQPGLLYLAKKAHVPLIHIECNPQWAFTFKKSWDQFKFPLPFSKIIITIHEPVNIP